jgi:hypothetical protein
MGTTVRVDSIRDDGHAFQLAARSVLARTLATGVALPQANAICSVRPQARRLRLGWDRPRSSNSSKPPSAIS